MDYPQHKTIHSLRRVALICSTLFGVYAFAQDDEDEEDIFELSPFEVDGSKDEGYRAESTLAGSRLNSSLRDTPATIQVYTKEFLEDLGALNLEDVLNYSANVENGAGDEEAFFGGDFAERGFVNFQARVRGLPSSRARDYFAWQLPVDNYLTERLDESRGPNALLFGIAAAGGIQNQSTKKASVSSDINRLVLRTDSEGLLRGEIDLNRVLIKDKLAIRINALHADGDGWQKNTYNEKKAIHLGMTFRPDDRTMIRLGYESFSQDDSVGNTFVETDYMKTWVDAGSPVFDLFSDNSVDEANASGVVNAANRNTVFRPEGVTTLGAAGQVTLIDGGDPSFEGSVVSFARALRSQNFLDNDGDGAFTDANNIPRDFTVYPQDVRFNGPTNERQLESSDFALTIQRELIDNLFVQADFAKYSYVWDTFANGANIRGDANAYFIGSDKTSATAVQNPNAGLAYVYNGNLTRWVTDREQETTRLTGTYEFDFADRGDGFLSKFGSHRIAAGFEHVEYLSDQPVIRLRWLDADTGRLAYVDGNVNHASNRVHSATYFDLNDSSTWVGNDFAEFVGVPVADPLDPSRMIVPEWVSSFPTPWHVAQDIDSKMFSAQSFFFDRHLVVTAGYREDEGVGSKFLYDLNELENGYTPNGEFETTDWSVENHTVGAVFHLNNSLSVFYNTASNSNIPDGGSVIIGALDKPGQITAPGGGEGEDFGLAASLFNDKIHVRLTRFESQEDNALNGNGAATNLDTRMHDQIIEWWSDIGFGLPDEPASERLFQDRVNRFALSKASEGYEAQVTANFTKNWRATVNFSHTDKEQTNVGILENQWIDDTMAWAYRTVENYDTSAVTPEMIAAGIPVDDPSTPENEASDPEFFLLENGVTTLAKQFENVDLWRETTMAPGSPFGLRRNKFNFWTNYSFKEGSMKGWSIGGGYRYQSPNLMHQEVDADGNLIRIEGEATSYVDAMVRYTKKIKMGGKNVKASFQVNVTNLFDDSDPIVGRYEGNSTANPADRLYYVKPRNVRVSATFDF